MTTAKSALCTQVGDWIKRLSASVPRIDSHIVGILIEREPEVLAAILDDVQAYADDRVAWSALSSEAQSASIDRTIARIKTLKADRRARRSAANRSQPSGVLRAIEGGRG